MARNQCNYCQNDISGYRVRCAVCPEFDLCLQCFSFGAEIGGHKKEHSYQISDRPLRVVDDEEGSDSGAKKEPVTGAFDVDQPWSLNEETMLLDAVEQYGFGNWEDVSSHVESREPSECEEHYVNYFIRGNVGKGTFSNEPFGKVIDHTCPDGGPLSPSITVPITPLELSLQEQHELGYMPFRDDFEREYDNDAETLVSSLSIHYDDEDLDIAIKLAQVEKYRMRLKERERRKRLARDYGLITAAAATAVGTPGAKSQKTPGPKKKGSKDERELLEKLKPFSQFHSKAEHQMYFENLQKQKEVKSRIKELLRYRKNGITKSDDVEDFEEEKFLRDKKKENRKKLVSVPTFLDHYKLFLRSLDNTSEPGANKKKLNGLKKGHRRRKIRYTYRRRRAKR